MKYHHLNLIFSNELNNIGLSEFNSKVEYNESITSWIVDIISCIIAFPMIVMVVYRRGKYNQKITEVESQDKQYEKI